MEDQAPMTPLGARTPHAHPAYIPVVAFLVAAVAIGGYLALAYSTGWWPFHAPAEGPTPSASPSPTATPQPMTGWKTYTNTDYGFAVRYPPDLSARTFVDEGVTFTILDVANEPIEGTGFNVQLSVHEGDAEQVYERTISDRSFVIENHETTLGGAQAFEVSIRSDYGADYALTFLQLDASHYLHIERGHRNALHEQILSTFKASAPDTTAEWKTYTSAQGGYSYQYPPSWNSVANQYSPTFSLFGPDATSGTGEGGVEMIDYPGTVEEYIDGIDATLISSSAATIDGIPAVRARFESHVGPMTAYYLKTVGTIVSVYLRSEDSTQIELLDRLVATFKFTK